MNKLFLKENIIQSRRNDNTGKNALKLIKIDKQNNFLFEKTSRISKEDILKAKNKMEEKEDKISSPYTKIGKTRYDFAPIVLLVVLLVFISLVVYLVLSKLKSDDDVTRELKGLGGDIIELTK